MRIGVVLLVMAAVMGLSALMADTARADGGPHQGNFGNTTDACAGCHRLHTGQAPKLLKEAQATLCLSCHGTAALGSDLNVEDGLYEVTGGGLRGGGFVNALMDTDVDGVPVSGAVSSAHTYDGTPATAWGNGAIGSGAGASITLECANCHNPHGNGHYRILRQQPLESGAPTPVVLADEVVKNYEISYSASNYRDVSYLAPVGDISNWCAQCHTRHLAVSGSGQTDSGDPIYAYRHMTDGLFGNQGCFNCHVAHGTTALMNTQLGGPEGTNFSQGVLYPDGTSDGAQNSRLLHVDNRGVCIQCHQPGGD